MQPRIERDSGISLIEVIVALVLIGAISATALVFFMRGMSNTTHLQRTQNASAVATQAMEAVRSIDPRSGTGILTTPLIKGRTSSEVTTAWNTALAAGHVTAGEMTGLSDPAASAGDTQLLPIDSESTIGRFTYNVTTLIGQCNVTKATIGNEQSCTIASPAGAIPMIRVRIIVEWSDGESGVCASRDCTYQLTSLIDPSEDASWNLSTKPVAYDDAGTFTIGDSTAYMAILVNDVITTFTSTPTTILSNPSLGSVSVINNNADDKWGNVNYTPPAAVSGAQSGATNFTYKIRDAQGRNSNAATVRLVILPLTQNDSAIVARNEEVVIPVLTNDYGTNLRPQITTPPSSAIGSATVNPDGTILFTPRSDSTAESVSFEYLVQDDYTSLSNPATVTVTIADPTPEVKDVEFIIDAQEDEEDVELNLQAELGLSSSLRINLVSGPTQMHGTTGGAGTLTLDGSGTSISYQPVENRTGTYTFVYTLQDGSSGLPSPEATATIYVVPVANNHTADVDEGQSEIFYLSHDASNIPNKSRTGLTYEFGTPSCGTLTVQNAGNGKAKFKAPNPYPPGGKCTVEYTIVFDMGEFRYDQARATVTFEDD